MSSHNRFRITGIERVRFAVVALDDACRFATDWGLSPVAGTAADSFLFRAQDGSEVEIVGADASLRERRPLGDSSGLVEITWGVTDPAALGRSSRSS